MDDAGSMSFLQRRCDLTRDRDGALRRHRSFFLEDVGERSSRYVPHGQEAEPFVLSDVVDADHVLVAHLASEPELAPEALDDRRVAPQVGAEDLQGRLDPELLVARPIDDAHSPDTGDARHPIPAGDECARRKPTRDVDARHCRRRTRGQLASLRCRGSFLAEVRRINHRSGSRAAASSSRRSRASAGEAGGRRAGDLGNAPPEHV